MKKRCKKEIKSLPGVYQISLNLLESELKEAYDLGIRAIMFFGVPNSKDDIGTGAYMHNMYIKQQHVLLKKCMMTY